MKRCFILADDFTGANDTGVQFRSRGIPTVVLFDGSRIPEEGTVIVDTESRALSASEAGAAVQRSLAGIGPSVFGLFMKKVDSTLRGNIAAEVRAADCRMHFDQILFAPALPDLGRTTKDGIHRLDGIPILETELARDPKTPVREDNIARLLQAEFDEPVVRIPLDQVSEDRIRLEGGRIFAFDAVTNADLGNIVRAGLAEKGRVLWVGAAAMAEQLIGAQSKVPPAVAVVGSVSSVTRRQVRYAEQEGTVLVRIPIYGLLDGTADPMEYAVRAAALLRENRDAVVLPTSSCDAEEMARTDRAGAERGMTPKEMCDYIREVLSQISRRILEAAPVSGAFLTGGDTAIGFIRAAEASGSSILMEIAAGIPMMRLIGGPYAGLKIITKAGAFGGDDAIVTAMKKLKEVIPL
ncbi:D-threonate kinase [Caprobacter fermentans]|uniref:D-threonate kinase n=1 Tax=Caproicibacter fermentans TaxID=2576756 RepID=A0A6N8I4F0_9FIRM|nr:D-threonate kinase [Caproicibacter fermentans]OCN01501.1 hypothetical protein A7X67_16115 [Clostridium sp. W14A]